MGTILIQASAKLNLDLKILGKRPDGYHEIESTFQSIDLSDFLLFEKSRKDYFTGGIICPESENIILKAKKILEKALKKNCLAKFISKNLFQLPPASAEAAPMQQLP